MPENINALYPQPPTNSLANMGLPQLVETANALTGLEARQRELAAQKALGSAYTSAPLAPSGAPDPAAVWSAFRQNPASAYGPVATAAAAAAQEQSRAQSELLMKQRDYVQARIAPLAFKKDLQPEEVISAIVDHGNALGLPSALIQAQVAGMVGKRGKALNDHLGNILSMTQGPVTAATRVEVAPEPGSIAPQKGPLGGYNYQQGAGAAPGVGIVGPAPGAAEAQKTEYETGAGVASKLLATASTIPEQRTQLDLMRADLATAGRIMGPTQAYETAANIVADRVLGITPTMSKQEIAAAQSFDKIAKQLAMAQAAAFHASDLSTTMAMGANPNSSLAGYSSEGIIDMLHGNYDMHDMKANEWTRARAAGVSPDQYFKWERQFNKDVDPRVFQFMRMNQEQQTVLLKSIRDKAAFENHLLDAHGYGWITLPGDVDRPNRPYRQQGLY